MIKKIFHVIWTIIFGVIWSVLLGLLFQQAFRLVYNINILSPRTYQIFNTYWNNGGVIKPNDLFMFFCLLLYIPICIYGWFVINKIKFANLIMVPLNWLANLGINQNISNVNIKNLKIEEKKTIDQIVKERIELENKKIEHKDSAEFRKKIVKKLEEEQNK